MTSIKLSAFALVALIASGCTLGQDLTSETQNGDVLYLDTDGDGNFDAIDVDGMAHRYCTGRGYQTCLHTYRADLAAFEGMADITTTVEFDVARRFSAAVGKSHRLSDYRDLLLMYLMSEDPLIVEGTSELVPDMLREVIKAGGVKKSDETAT